MFRPDGYVALHGLLHFPIGRHRGKLEGGTCEDRIGDEVAEEIAERAVRAPAAVELDRPGIAGQRGEALGHQAWVGIVERGITREEAYDLCRSPVVSLPKPKVCTEQGRLRNCEANGNAG